MQCLKWLGYNYNLFQTLKCIYLLKKEWEEVFITLLKDLVKQVINRCNFMMIKTK